MAPRFPSAQNGKKRTLFVLFFDSCLGPILRLELAKVNKIWLIVRPLREGLIVVEECLRNLLPAASIRGYLSRLDWIRRYRHLCSYWGIFHWLHSWAVRQILATLTNFGVEPCYSEKFAYPSGSLWVQIRRRTLYKRKPIDSWFIHKL